MRRRGSSCGGVRGRAQRGAIGVLGALLLVTVAVGALVSIDVGHVFYRQRELQKIADMAALAGAQQLKQAGPSATVSANVLAATQAAGTQNGYGGAAAAGCASPAAGGTDGMNVCLGVWDPAYTAGADTARHFKAGYDANAQSVSANAVQVVVTQTVPILFVIPGGTARQLRAEAIANASPPVASFSLGSGLLDFQSANSLLGTLLGTAVNFSVLDWNGLLNTTVTLDQLRLKLGLGSVDELLKTSLSIQQFYALVLGAAGKDALLSTALGSPPTKLGLGGAAVDVGLGKLLNLGVLAPAASSAADVGLNVASLLMLGAQVANGNAAIALPTTNINVPNIAGVSAQLYVISPPVTAVGPARQVSSGVWQTTAHNAQVGLRLDIAALGAMDTSKTTTLVGVLVAPLLGLINVGVNVPLYVEVASATASLQSIQCAAAKADCRAAFGVNTGVAKACLAAGVGSGAGCASGPVTIVETGIPLLSTTVKVTATGPTKTGSALNNTVVTLAPGATTRVGTANPLTGILLDVVGSLNLKVEVTVLGIPLLGIPLPLAGLLTPLFQALDLVVGPLLGALGIQLGYADIWLNDIDCNNAELVF
ncbi:MULTISPECIES: TadG family pilus assembly protein [Cupriavidus]